MTRRAEFSGERKTDRYEVTGQVFGIKWFGPKRRDGTGFVVRSWQGWVLIGLYTVLSLLILPVLPLHRGDRFQLWSILTSLFIGIIAIAYDTE